MTLIPSIHLGRGDGLPAALFVLADAFNDDDRVWQFVNTEDGVIDFEAMLHPDMPWSQSEWLLLTAARATFADDYEGSRLPLSEVLRMDYPHLDTLTEAMFVRKGSRSERFHQAMTPLVIED